MSTTPKKKTKATGKGAALLKVLQPVAASLGADIEAGRIAPVCDITMPISHVARTLGQVLRLVNIFNQGDAIVTVDERTGDTKPMRADRFCSWVEEYVAIVKPKEDGLKPTSMNAETAAKVLVADQFRDGLRVLAAVHSVRLPVWEEYGKAVRLLDAGYDERTQVYTVDALPYALDMEPTAAVAFFLDILKGYPWSDEGKLQTRRSLAVHLAAMLGNFVRLLFEEGTQKPVIVYNGNQPGTGKSTLARMGLSPVYGVPEDKALPKSEDELRKELDAFAMARRPYMFLDDVGGHLRSHLLNRFITSPMHTGRKMGTGELFTAPNVTQVFITGNGLTLSPDLARRCLIVDLFCAVEARGRKFERIITDAWLSQEGTRAQFLAALWALVRYWQQCGCNRHDHLLESFEEWSAIVGGIVVEAGFCDPIKAAPELAMDEQGEAFKRLFCALAADLTDGTEKAFSVADCREKAEDLDIWETLVTGAMDQGKAFGIRLGKFRGRQWTDAHGRLFEFGRKQTGKSSVYPLRFIKPTEATG
jgi:hypothetical protein